MPASTATAHSKPLRSTRAAQTSLPRVSYRPVMTRRAAVKNSARPAGFPGEHLSGGVLPEEPVASEIAEHASTDRLPEGLHVGAGDGGGLVEADGGAGRVVGAVPCRGLEDAVKDADVVVEVGVERGKKRLLVVVPRRDDGFHVQGRGAPGQSRPTGLDVVRGVLEEPVADLRASRAEGLPVPSRQDRGCKKPLHRSTHLQTELREPEPAPAGWRRSEDGEECYESDPDFGRLADGSRPCRLRLHEGPDGL